MACTSLWSAPADRVTYCREVPRMGLGLGVKIAREEPRTGSRRWVSRRAVACGVPGARVMSACAL